eukprot:TRINITY_DN10755_c0_g1_i1.p1 TRINITY_DN10755_c0_g1~~TRINITY_DN10755_c0_g1_i1.p1  ORF type:complete len:843 (-),score=200.28 TRINITY_DN10755_c0_g1_i1:32-2560(-)
MMRRDLGRDSARKPDVPPKQFQNLYGAPSAPLPTRTGLTGITSSKGAASDVLARVQALTKPRPLSATTARVNQRHPEERTRHVNWSESDKSSSTSPEVMPVTKPSNRFYGRQSIEEDETSSDSDHDVRAKRAQQPATSITAAPVRPLSAMASTGRGLEVPAFLRTSADPPKSAPEPVRKSSLPPPESVPSLPERRSSSSDLSDRRTVEIPSIASSNSSPTSTSSSPTGSAQPVTRPAFSAVGTFGGTVKGIDDLEEMSDPEIDEFEEEPSPTPPPVFTRRTSATTSASAATATTSATTITSRFSASTMSAPVSSAAAVVPAPKSTPMFGGMVSIEDLSDSSIDSSIEEETPPPAKPASAAVTAGVKPSVVSQPVSTFGRPAAVSSTAPRPAAVTAPVVSQVRSSGLSTMGLTTIDDLTDSTDSVDEVSDHQSLEHSEVASETSSGESPRQVKQGPVLVQTIDALGSVSDIDTSDSDSGHYSPPPIQPKPQPVTVAKPALAVQPVATPMLQPKSGMIQPLSSQRATPVADPKPKPQLIAAQVAVAKASSAGQTVYSPPVQKPISNTTTAAAPSNVHLSAPIQRTLAVQPAVVVAPKSIYTPAPDEVDESSSISEDLGANDYSEVFESYHEHSESTPARAREPKRFAPDVSAIQERIFDEVDELDESVSESPSLRPTIPSVAGVKSLQQPNLQQSQLTQQQLAQQQQMFHEQQQLLFKQQQEFIQQVAAGFPNVNEMVQQLEESRRRVLTEILQPVPQLTETNLQNAMSRFHLLHAERLLYQQQMDFITMRMKSYQQEVSSGPRPPASYSTYDRYKAYVAEHRPKVLSYQDALDLIDKRQADFY